MSHTLYVCSNGHQEWAPSKPKKCSQCGCPMDEITPEERIILHNTAEASRQEEPGREITVSELLRWMRSRPGISWVATIRDIEWAVAALQKSPLTSRTLS